MREGERENTPLSTHTTPGDPLPSSTHNYRFQITVLSAEKECFVMSSKITDSFHLPTARWLHHLHATLTSEPIPASGRVTLPPPPSVPCFLLRSYNKLPSPSRPAVPKVCPCPQVLSRPKNRFMVGINTDPLPLSKAGES